jgi:aspartate kinase
VADVAVLKLGGSVLTDVAAYRTCGRFLREEILRTHHRLVVVVSAQEGHTDVLRGDAELVSPAPESDALDLLWSTGELRSVALLTLALRAEGVAAAGLNVHESGLHVAHGDLTLNPLSLWAALGRCEVVVVPGFLATQRQQIVTLGRGGSDWSAVALAAALGAVRCELIKDVPGYFTADPRGSADAALIEHLSYATAIAMADDGCPLVQRQAIDHAQRNNLPLVVRSLDSRGTKVA